MASADTVDIEAFANSAECGIGSGSTLFAIHTAMLKTHQKVVE